MRVARWKLMGGALLLSAGGLMAVADGPNPPPITLPGCQPAPLPVERVVYLSPPVAVPAPRVAELPPPAPALPPAPPTLPAVPVATQFGVPSPPNTTVQNLVIGLSNSGPTTVPGGAVPPPALAATDPRPAPVAPRVDLPASLPPAFSPVPVIEPKPAVPVMASPAPEPPAPLPLQPVAAPAPAVPAEKPLAIAADRPERTPTTAEKRLKVVLHMGDDRPRFEVRDGDEIYLKVVSDRVEVKSAADKADAATMKAGGKVGFVTPGGDGTCDELTILPGSGQVVATGNVAFRHTWGRSETTVTAERMTFRLAHPGPTAIQAGYTPIK